MGKIRENMLVYDPAGGMVTVDGKTFQLVDMLSGGVFGTGSTDMDGAVAAALDLERDIIAQRNNVRPVVGIYFPDFQTLAGVVSNDGALFLPVAEYETDGDGWRHLSTPGGGNP